MTVTVPRFLDSEGGYKRYQCDYCGRYTTSKGAPEGWEVIFVELTLSVRHKCGSCREK